MIEQDKRYLTKVRWLGDASRHNRVTSSTPLNTQQARLCPAKPGKCFRLLSPPPPPPRPGAHLYFPGEHLDLSRTDEAETDGPTQRHRHVPTYQHARR